jgi:hypothetical protein
MNKKYTRLLNTSTIEALTKKENCDPKTAFVIDWLKKNPNLFQELIKESKETLALTLINKWVGQLYEKIQHESLGSNDISQRLDAYLPMIDCLLEGTTEEQAKALAEWESKMIAEAGNNATRIAKIARAAGATDVRIKESPKFKAFKEREAALKKGRSEGTQAQQEYAAETIKLIETLNSDLLKHPDTARWTLTKRAEYIEKELIKNKRKQINGTPYKFSTIKKRITGKEVTSDG